jgi:NADPH:quinone reductase-like Zn-dependent oxidoreductase
VKAVRFHEHGGPEVLRYEDAPDPVPAPGWILVRVRACALNHLDLWQRRGLERVTIPLPHVSGADVAGEIAALGEGVTAVRAGDRVMLQPGLSCGRCPRCLAGEDNFCPAYDVLGYQSDGGYAELVTVPAANAVPLPETIDFTTAAAFPLSFLTAWHMLHTRARLVAGETVLVVAAGSGVGQAAVQLANAAGARVIATAGSDAKVAMAKSIGADDVIDHHHDDVVARVRELTGRRGVDVVVEHVGVATWDRSVRSLARGGRLVTCGATTGHDAKLDLRHLFARQLSFLGSYMGGKPELLRAAELFFRGEVRPVVDRTFPLSETAQAQRHLESSAQFGKVVLEV